MKAVRDFWVIGGDQFADDAGRHLMTYLKNNNEGGPKIHLHDFYDVSYQGGSTYDTNPLSKFRNAVATILSSKWKIPHSVLLVFGGKTFLKDSMIVQDGPNKIISWLLDETKRMIFHRRQQMPAKALPNFATRIFIVGLLPVNNSREQLKRDKFNVVLQEVTKNKEAKFILVNTVKPTDELCYNAQGQLTPIGFSKFWKEISEAVNLIDMKGYSSYLNLIKMSMTQKYDGAYNGSEKNTKNDFKNLDNKEHDSNFAFADQRLIITSQFGGNPDETVRSVHAGGNRISVNSNTNPNQGATFHRIDDTITDILQGENWYHNSQPRQRGGWNNRAHHNRKGYWKRRGSNNAWNNDRHY